MSPVTNVTHNRTGQKLEEVERASTEELGWPRARCGW